MEYLGQLDNWERDCFLIPDQESLEKKRGTMGGLGEPLMADPFGIEPRTVLEYSEQSSSPTTSERDPLLRRDSTDIADQTERGPVNSPVKSTFLNSEALITDDSLAATPSAIHTLHEDSPISNQARDPFKSFVTMNSMPLILHPMPLAGTPGTPCFKGSNITEFVERFDDLCDEFRVTDEEKKRKLLKYCDHPRREIIQSLPEYDDEEKT